MNDKEIMDNLPYITSELPGIGGEIKSEPEHFIVEEIPLYEPGGTGDHIYVRISRDGWNTRDLIKRLADIFELKDVDIGCAGQKDKHARAIQTFSLLLPKMPETLAARKIEEALPVEVQGVKRHNNKLKTGHLLGNRFTIILAGPANEALESAEKTAAMIKKRGLANYYGVQRFGADGDNAIRGKEILEGKGPRQKWMKKFLLSAFQSQLFNTWLAGRINDGLFESLLTGDIAKKTDTGGLFEVEDAEVELDRFESGAITYTGPIFGSKMRWAKGRAGDMERNVLDEAGVTIEMLKKARLDGSRRPARIFLPDLSVEPHEKGLKFEFALPKGSYATTVMREFTKQE